MRSKSAFAIIFVTLASASIGRAEAGIITTMEGDLVRNVALALTDDSYDATRRGGSFTADAGRFSQSGDRNPSAPSTSSSSSSLGAGSGSLMGGSGLGSGNSFAHHFGQAGSLFGSSSFGGFGFGSAAGRLGDDLRTLASSLGVGDKDPSDRPPGTTNPGGVLTSNPGGALPTGPSTNTDPPRPAVPEPATWISATIGGLFGLGYGQRRRMRSRLAAA